MRKSARPREVSEEEEDAFLRRWETAKADVSRVFEKDRRVEVEEMVQWTWERAWKDLPGALRDAKKDAAKGKEMEWVGRWVTIAQRLLVDAQRKMGRLEKKLGQRVQLEGRWLVIRGGEGVVRVWSEHADRRGPSVEEQAEWDVLCALLHRTVGRLPLLDRLILYWWSHRENNAEVARELGITEPAARRRRKKLLPWLRAELEGWGYEAATRPRQPEGQGSRLPDESSRIPAGERRLKVA